jgi:hypothetical protein
MTPTTHAVSPTAIDDTHAEKQMDDVFDLQQRDWGDACNFYLEDHAECP